jgi:hypothetical protein
VHICWIGVALLGERGEDAQRQFHRLQTVLHRTSMIAHGPRDNIGHLTDTPLAVAGAYR